MILVILMLILSLIIMLFNGQIFLSDSEVVDSGQKVEQTTEDKEQYVSKNRVDDSNISFFQKVKNKVAGATVPTITIENSEIDVLSTEIDQYDDAMLIEKFGVEAKDSDGNLLDISVEKTKKSDILTKVTFKAQSDSGYIVSCDALMNVIYNSKPKLTVKNRKLSFSKRKYNRYSEERMKKYITRKAHVKAWDNEDGRLDTDYDLSAVDSETTGDYKVTIKATDDDNQTTTAEMVISIK